VILRFALLTLLVPVATASPSLDRLLHAVEQRYNGARSLSLRFEETYTAQRRPHQTETGVLSMQKPGRMFWDYRNPAGKFFLSDGKNLYLYTPDDHRVEKSPLKDSEDLHAPLAFLLGKLNFYKEFRSFETHPEGENTWISAQPNSDSLPYAQVEFLVTPQNQIRKVRVTGQDRSTIDYSFSEERLNPPLSPTVFAFRLPAGAEVVEADR